jgi:hypothetical protein
MHFDQRRGTRIVGSNVRDAAAYVIWSLARACEPAELTPFADDLARHLILTSLFDREIHIRRAASAAFQEIVGRLVRPLSVYCRSQRGNCRLTGNCRAWHRASTCSRLLHLRQPTDRLSDRGSGRSEVRIE